MQAEKLPEEPSAPLARPTVGMVGAVMSPVMGAVSRLCRGGPQQNGQGGEKGCARIHPRTMELRRPAATHPALTAEGRR